MTMEEDLTQVARRICATATVFTRSRVEGHQQGRHGGLGGVLLLLGGHCLHKEQGWEGSSQDAMVVWEVRCISDLAIKIKDRPACTPSVVTTKCLATHFCMFLASGGFIPSSVMPPTYAALGLGHNGRICT
jgi:hypothetical protein